MGSGWGDGFLGKGGSKPNTGWNEGLFGREDSGGSSRPSSGWGGSSRRRQKPKSRQPSRHGLTMPRIDTSGEVFGQAGGWGASPQSAGDMMLTRADLNLEGLLTSGAGFANTVIGHVPGGYVIKECILTFYGSNNPTIDSVMDFALYHPEGPKWTQAKTLTDILVIAKGQLDPITYDKSISVPTMEVGPKGHMKPLYAFWQLINGAASSIGTVVMSLRLSSMSANMGDLGVQGGSGNPNSD